MTIASLKLATFSPTGTSKAVARAIARGIAPDAQDTVELVDITRPDVRKTALQTGPDNLLIITAPVYMGRIPALLGEWFEGLQGQNTPAVCVVVFGNRAYENALIELADAVTERGFVPVACGAYIGEHSFSSPELPTAHGRPDADDLKHAEEFGRRIRDKMATLGDITQAPPVAFPGERPYAGRTELWDVDFIAVSDACVQCGLCAETCPMGAIDPEDSAAIDTVKCITCCACIKECPQQARSMKPGPVHDAATRLNTNCAEPKQPECYL